MNTSVARPLAGQGRLGPSPRVQPSWSRTYHFIVTPGQIKVLKGTLQGDNRMWLENTPIHRHLCPEGLQGQGAGHGAVLRSPVG